MIWPGASVRTDKQVSGAAGEDKALQHLEARGLTLVQRNFRCKGGEIDLIMRERTTLVFVEVRKRSDARFGGAAASVTSHKQARLVLAAQYFLQRYREPPACRFDVVAIDAERIDWLVDAFQT